MQRTLNDTEYVCYIYLSEKSNNVYTDPNLVKIVCVSQC